MQDFRGKTAFVTGGASGLGLSMARAFGRAGMNVVLADIDDKAAKAAAEQLAAEQIKAVPVHCDVSERSGVARSGAGSGRRVRQGPCRLQQCRCRGRRADRHGARARLGLDHRRQSEERRLWHRSLRAADQEPRRRRAFRQHRVDGRHDLAAGAGALLRHQIRRRRDERRLARPARADEYRRVGAVPRFRAHAHP